MALFLRCDVCRHESSVFWTLKIERKRLDYAPPSASPPQVTQENLFSFDVCSARCEAQAFLACLKRIAPTLHDVHPGTGVAPVVDPIDQAEPSFFAPEENDAGPSTRPFDRCRNCGVSRAEHRAGKTMCPRFKPPFPSP